MTFDIRERNRVAERAILVGVITPDQVVSYDEPLAELASLAATAGVEVVGTMVQRRLQFHSGTYVGSGKLEQLVEKSEELGATLLVFNDGLTPGQAKSIEKATGIRVIDRVELILDIFALHAQTKEAKLQVELAQLQYALPRLKRMWTHLHNQQGGVGFRGPGEKQLEMDRQLIKNRISDYKSALEGIQKRKEREVEGRNQKFTTVGLVGYTNAGKSSLMSALTEADVLVEDKLFATLDTKTRMWEVHQGREVLLSDTVGFIDRLPHRLIASFKATLEEASQADILLHVVDSSHPDVENHLHTVDQVLKDIGLEDHPILYVFNKIDLAQDEAAMGLLREQYPNHVCISARTGENLDVLQAKVLEMMERSMVEVNAVIPAGNGKVISWLSRYGRILEQRYSDSKVCFKVTLAEKNFRWLEKQAGIDCSVASN